MSKWASSSSLMLRNNIAGRWRKRIKISIWSWCWSIFDCWKSRRGQSNSKFRPLIFTNFCYWFSAVKFNSFICSRAGTLSMWKVLINNIDSLWSYGIGRCSSSWFFILVLHRNIYTASGPGCLWIWGIKYDLSGDSYRLRPKVNPFNLVYSW